MALAQSEKAREGEGPAIWLHPSILQSLLLDGLGATRLIREDAPLSEISIVSLTAGARLVITPPRWQRVQRLSREAD